jgi:hypothetical protein
MFWYSKYFMGNLKMDKAGGDSGGGGGNPPPADPPKDPAPGNSSKEIEELRNTNKTLLERLEALEKKGNPPVEDDDLKTKADKENAEKNKRNQDSKALESALRFSMGAPEFLKTNASLLPKGVEDIFKLADKETYDNALEKDAAIKTGLVQSFFEIQANVDLLTGSQKSALEEWQKLTKNGKQDRAREIYDSLFEPTFEMLKRIKKAEQMSKGLGASSDQDIAYKEKMMKLSKAHYMGEKSDA